MVDEFDWLGEGIERMENGDVVRHGSELGLYFQKPNIFQEKKIRMGMDIRRFRSVLIVPAASHGHRLVAGADFAGKAIHSYILK